MIPSAKHQEAVDRALLNGLYNVDVCTTHPFVWKITSIRNGVRLPVRHVVRDLLSKSKSKSKNGKQKEIV